jgi:hypothetical protein
VAEVAEKVGPRRLSWLSWLSRTWRAFRFGVSGLDAPLLALSGFLARGGVVPLALSGVIVPSALVIERVIGLEAVSIDGRPTPWAYQVAVIGIVVAAVWFLAASLFGSLVDVWLVRPALDPDRPSALGRLPLPSLGLLLRLAAIRVLCLVPLILVLIWAGFRFYDAIYTELTFPTNLTSPLEIRVVESALDAVVVVVLVWLAMEVIGAIAVRRLILTGSGVWQSIGDAVEEVTRRPASILLTTAAAYGASLVAILIALAATSTAFDWCRIAARNTRPIAITMGLGDFSTTRDFRPVAFALAVTALTIAWICALALVGAASAWRSAAFSHEVAATLPGTDGSGVSTAARSGGRRS